MSDEDRSDSSTPSQRRRDDDRAVQQMWAMAGVGVEFIAAVGGMTLLGWWIDRSFDWTPTLTITGLVVGFIGGLYNLVRSARRAFRK
jgi:F0F1-type ATP synthase assembly protein I